MAGNCQPRLRQDPRPPPTALQVTQLSPAQIPAPRAPGGSES